MADPDRNEPGDVTLVLRRASEGDAQATDLVKRFWLRLHIRQDLAKRVPTDVDGLCLQVFDRLIASMPTRPSLHGVR